MFNPTTDIPDLSGKVILVTGGTAGIGKESVLELAKHNPARISFTGRDAKRAAEVITAAEAVGGDSVAVVFVECDLTSLASVHQAAKRIASESDRLDILICSAGVLVPAALTKDGYEVHFGINHIAHALLIKLLLPTLLRTCEVHHSDVRIVSTTSEGFFLHPRGGILFDSLRTARPASFKLARYGQSKLANILFAAELARRHPQLVALSVHPGTVRTELVAKLDGVTKALTYLGRPFSMKTPKEGAYNQLWAATADREGIVNGEYYEPVGVRGRHARKSRNVELAKRLWEWTEKELVRYQL
ncbi:oxidoreductase [Mycena pura]|uniref:Oxidoreductase n=1 Tax=Mycena pura TaxID=153505 RepID=A0AAD6UKG7_9AGAR|nr:oxidoreductase [Mycena pura]